MPKIFVLVGTACLSALLTSAMTGNTLPAFLVGFLASVGIGFSLMGIVTAIESLKK